MGLKDKMRHFIHKSTLGLMLATPPIGGQVQPINSSPENPIPDAKEIMVDNPYKHVVQNLPEQDVSTKNKNNNVVETQNTADQSGYKITYEDGTYMFADENGMGFAIHENEFDLDKRREELKHVRDSVFSSETKFSFMEDVAEGDVEIKAQYLSRKNQIQINPNINTDVMISLLERKGLNNISQLSPEDTKAQYDAYNDIIMKSLRIHEESHRDMDKQGVYDAFVNVYDIGRIKMMDEVRANLEQTGLALQYYKATGRAEGFDLLYNCGTDVVNDMKSYITNPENQNKLDSEETKAFLTQAALTGWIKENNISGSPYSDETAMFMNEVKFEYLSREISEQEYIRVTKAMFENLPHLGDVSAYITPNFQLNSDLENMCTIFAGSRDEELKTKATEGAQTPYEAAEMFSQALTPLKDATLKALEDGVITAEENEHLDNLSQGIVNKMFAPKTAENNHGNDAGSSKQAQIVNRIYQLKDKLKTPETDEQETNTSHPSSGQKITINDVLYHRMAGKNIQF